MESIGAYRVLSRVGDGGMAVVYRCRHRSDAKAAQQGGDVAVKVMHAHLAADTGFQTRFEREAGIGLELDHPGIVKVLDLIVDQDRLALVMEWVEGDPLDMRLARGPIPEAQALEIFHSVAQALSYAHEQGVVHRDVKPANIILAPKCAKVLDFGIAKSAQQASLTRTGAGIGTPWYMAPEQYTRAKSVDARADIYALGMVLAEMLLGGLPWPTELSEYEVLRHKADGELSLDRVPKAYIPIIERCLEPDPEDRWASVQALLTALRGEDDESAQEEEDTDESAQASTPPEPAPEAKTPKSKPSRAGCWVLALFGCLGVLGIGPVMAVFVIAVLTVFATPESNEYRPPGRYGEATNRDSGLGDADFDGLLDWEDPCKHDQANTCSMATSSLYSLIGVQGLWKGTISSSDGANASLFIRINAGGARGKKVGDVDYVWNGNNSCGGNLIRSSEDFLGLNFREQMVRGYMCEEFDLTVYRENGALVYSGTNGLETWTGTLYRIPDN